MMKFELVVLALFAIVALPTLIDADCVVTTKCPDVTVTPAEKTEYCTPLKTHMDCLKKLLDEDDCKDEKVSITTKVAADAVNYEKYKCGAAGLVGSTIMCLIVFVMSMVVKT